MNADHLRELQRRAEKLASDLRAAKAATMDAGNEDAFQALEDAEDDADNARCKIGIALTELGE